MAKKRTNEELVDDLMEYAMAGFAMSGSGPDGSLGNVLRQNPTLQRLRREVLKRMLPLGVRKVSGTVYFILATFCHSHRM